MFKNDPFFVMAVGYFSNWGLIRAVVLQEILLGPTLIIVDINDIPTSKHCNNLAVVTDVTNIVSVFCKAATI